MNIQTPLYRFNQQNSFTSFDMELTNEILFTPKTSGMNYRTIKTELRNKGHSMSMIADVLKGMTGSEIIKAIRAKGFTLTLLAEASGAQLSTVSGVVHRHTTSKRIAVNICKVLGKPVDEVFADVETYTNPAYITSRLQKEEKRLELDLLLAS